MSYQPSFKKEIDRLYTIRWIAQNNYGQEHISWESKLKYKKLADDLGVKTAATYQLSDSLDDLTEPTQDRWVLKPCRGSANRGVFPVVRKKGWYSIFTNKTMTWQEIVKSCKRADNVKGPYIVEEFIGDGLPDNWEIYCFYGEVGLIRQRRQVKGRNYDGRTHKFWTPEWEDAGELDERIYNHNLPAPYNPEGVLETAKKLSLALPFTFARIDLYDTPQDVYFGEITHHPGPGNNFSKELDTKLGRMWLNAEARR